MRFRHYILLPLLIVLPSVAFSWGQNGHIIIARLAEERLTPVAKKAIEALIGTKQLHMIAYWADKYRDSDISTEKWHSVNIPDQVNNYDPLRDCKSSDSGDCAIQALEREIAVLKNKSASNGERTRALMFVVHLIGDVHQPFNTVERNGDHNATRLMVLYLGRPYRPGHGTKRYNLHYVWDEDLVAYKGLSPVAHRAILDSYLESQDTVTIVKGTIIQWVEESHAITAQEYVSREMDIEDQYAEHGSEIVDQQLARAGIRLAKVLNDALQ